MDVMVDDTKYCQATNHITNIGAGILRQTPANSPPLEICCSDVVAAYGWGMAAMENFVGRLLMGVSNSVISNATLVICHFQ